MDKDILVQKTYYNELYSYYQLLLTTKQQTIFEYYYADDLSLAEIAEELKISRNAVYDALKTVLSYLDQLEEKLKLYQKGLKVRNIIAQYADNPNSDIQTIINQLKEDE